MSPRTPLLLLEATAGWPARTRVGRRRQM